MAKLDLTEIVEKCWPPEKWLDFTVLIGVSGGADSVCLLRVVDQIRKRVEGTGQVIVAHVNHSLREQASDEDARFVEQLCNSLGIPIEVETLSAIDRNPGNRGTGLEAALRSQRYQVFERIAANKGARYILTAHTFDDQVETVLFRILRGTGIKGLAGIPQIRRINESLSVVRPFLGIRKTEIHAYLSRIGQSFREDESNQLEQFTRNQLRNTILPAARRCFGNDIDQSLENLSHQARDLSLLLDRLAEPVLEKHFVTSPGVIRISPIGLADHDVEILKVAIRVAWSNAGFPSRDMTMEKWRGLADFLAQANLPNIMFYSSLPGDIECKLEENHIRLSARTNPVQEERAP